MFSSEKLENTKIIYIMLFFDKKRLKESITIT